MSKKDKQLQILAKYLPEEFVNNIHEQLTTYPLDFKIVKPRKTKLGDYRYDPRLPRPVITVNSDLNPFQFLVTTVHELAHFHAFRKFGNRIKAHGKEWQGEYRRLSMPYIDSAQLPKTLEAAWLDSLVSVKASSCSDPKLVKVLRSFSPQKEGLVSLDELPQQAIFVLNGKEFEKGTLRRKRYLCTETTSNKIYLISSTAEVEYKTK